MALTRGVVCIALVGWVAGSAAPTRALAADFPCKDPKHPLFAELDAMIEAAKTKDPSKYPRLTSLIVLHDRFESNPKRWAQQLVQDLKSVTEEDLNDVIRGDMIVDFLGLAEDVWKRIIAPWVAENRPARDPLLQEFRNELARVTYLYIKRGGFVSEPMIYNVLGHEEALSFFKTLWENDRVRKSVLYISAEVPMSDISAPLAPAEMGTKQFESFAILAELKNHYADSPRIQKRIKTLEDALFSAGSARPSDQRVRIGYQMLKAYDGYSKPLTRLDSYRLTEGLKLIALDAPNPRGYISDGGRLMSEDKFLGILKQGRLDASKLEPKDLAALNEAFLNALRPHSKLKRSAGAPSDLMDWNFSSALTPASKVNLLKDNTWLRPSRELYIALISALRSPERRSLALELLKVKQMALIAISATPRAPGVDELRLQLIGELKRLASNPVGLSDVEVRFLHNAPL